MPRAKRSRGAAAALAAALVAAASPALAVVRVAVQTVPARPVAGQYFRVVYGLTVQNDGAAQATPLRFEGLQVVMDAQPPSSASFMFGGAVGGPGSTFTMTSNSEYVVVARAPGRYTVRNARAVSLQTGREVARAPDLVITVDPPGAAQPAPPAQPVMVPFGLPPGFPPFPPGVMTPDEPPPVQVIAADPDAPPPGDLSGASYDASGFARVVVDNPTPYVGQLVTLRAWLYVPSTEVQCDVEREPQLTGFWNELFIQRGQFPCARNWFAQTVNGQSFSAGLSRKWALYPTRAGRLEIGGLGFVAEYVEGDGFFGQRRRIQARSPSLVIDAREEPAEGRPPGYVPGMLGPLTLTASLDRETMAVGETATLTVRAEGNGYLGAVGIPAPAAVEGLRMHPGASHRTVDLSNERDPRSTLLVEHLIVPERPGAHALGSITVPWFDPGDGHYHTTTVTLPTLTAQGAALQRDDEGRRDDPAIVLDPIDPDPSLTPYTPFFTTGLRVWGAIALPPVALALAGLSRGLRRWREARIRSLADTERNDPDALLKRAEKALGDNDSAKAADLAGRALDRAKKEYGVARLGGEDRALVDAATAACDTLRFAGADGGDVKAAVAKVRDAVRAMERLS